MKCAGPALRKGIKTLLWTAPLLLLGSALQAPPARPNVLLSVADDLGWSDVGWHGGPAKTPRMDALVMEGVELDRHYVQPVCTTGLAAAQPAVLEDLRGLPE